MFHEPDLANRVEPYRFLLETVVPHMKRNGDPVLMKHIALQLSDQDWTTPEGVAQGLMRVSQLLNAGEVRMELESAK